MTNEEAIRLLKIVRDCGGYRNSEGFMFTDAFNEAIEAVEKQIPKKPEEYYVGCHGVYPLWEYKCPCCGMYIDYMDHHCECGQAIDWSEYDDDI